MSHQLEVRDSITGANVLPHRFVCSRTSRGPDAAWVRVAGELDLSTLPQLVKALSEPRLQPRLVVLDLRELEFIDSSGVRAIVEADSRARQTGRQLLLLRGPANVDRMFKLTGIADQLGIEDLGPAQPFVRRFRKSVHRIALDELGPDVTGSRPAQI
jgi:anti-sigma B factor antagonist